ncbi:adenosine deaminase-like isoform X2 [Dermacentor variabilis]|uniref:adenosine deaminase-like isoform X2 n=1 Tax=Dermacentor variabilis TaxID=34621 RepID=UPI003F5B553C
MAHWCVAVSCASSGQCESPVVDSWRADEMKPFPVQHHRGARVHGSDRRPADVRDGVRGGHRPTRPASAADALPAAYATPTGTLLPKHGLPDVGRSRDVVQPYRRAAYTGQKARKRGSSHMQQETRRTMPLLSYKVQLHSHLDTYMRHETIWELSQQKDLGLNYNTVEDVRERTRPKKCTSLDRYLKEVPTFLRTILGDRDALERVAYEAGLDQARERVLYSEMRLPPQLLAASSTVLPLGGSPASAVSGRDVVDAALTGLRRAEQETGIKLRLILTCLRGTPEWAPEVLDLCREYSDRGVVGIDVCGVVAQRAEDRRAAPSIEYGEEVTDPRIVQAFQRAASWGVHRTAHAGEAGPPAAVLRAVQELRAERIGHGYRAVLDGGLAYRQALAADVHFECCLTSSMLTGAVDPNSAHPVLRLRRDGASFSISVDDPAITHTRLEDEYRLALKLGLGPGDLLQCNRSAISACFLPADEKWELWQKFNQLTNAETADT